MKRYSKISVLLTRFVPLARTAISLIAGVARMNLAEFVIFSTIGIFIWNCLLITGGTFISELFRLEYITIEVLLALILAIVIIYLIKKLYDIYRDK